MEKIPKWPDDLSDEDFVELSKQYFALQIWDLHTAVCLWNKLNPQAKTTPVGEYLMKSGNADPNKDDPTDRGFKVAYEAIACDDENVARDYGIIRLPSLSCPRSPKNAKEIDLNPRHFISWLEQKYPTKQPHMQAAEQAYQARKTPKNPQKEKWGGL